MKRIIILLILVLMLCNCTTTLKIQEKEEQSAMAIAPNGDIYLFKNNKLYRIYKDKNGASHLELVPLNIKGGWNSKQLSILNNY